MIFLRGIKKRTDSVVFLALCAVVLLAVTASFCWSDSANGNPVAKEDAGGEAGDVGADVFEDQGGEAEDEDAGEGEEEEGGEEEGEKPQEEEADVSKDDGTKTGTTNVAEQENRPKTEQSPGTDGEEVAAVTISPEEPTAPPPTMDGKNATANGENETKPVDEQTPEPPGEGVTESITDGIDDFVRGPLADEPGADNGKQKTDNGTAEEGTPLGDYEGGGIGADEPQADFPGSDKEYVPWEIRLAKVFCERDNNTLDYVMCGFRIADPPHEIIGITYQLNKPRGSNTLQIELVYNGPSVVNTTEPLVIFKDEIGVRCTETKQFYNNCSTTKLFQFMNGTDVNVCFTLTMQRWQEDPYKFDRNIPLNQYGKVRMDLIDFGSKWDEEFAGGGLYMDMVRPANTRGCKEAEHGH